MEEKGWMCTAGCVTGCVVGCASDSGIPVMDFVGVMAVDTTRHL